MVTFLKLGGRGGARREARVGRSCADFQEEIIVGKCSVLKHLHPKRGKNPTFIYKVEEYMYFLGQLSLSPRKECCELYSPTTQNCTTLIGDSYPYLFHPNQNTHAEESGKEQGEGRKSEVPLHGFLKISEYSSLTKGIKENMCRHLDTFPTPTPNLDFPTKAGGVTVTEQPKSNIW